MTCAIGAPLRCELDPFAAGAIHREADEFARGDALEIGAANETGELRREIAREIDAAFCPQTSEPVSNSHEPA